MEKRTTSRAVSQNAPRQPITMGQIMLYATVTAMGVFFLSNSAAFVYSRIANPDFQFYLPVIFHVNTVIILASSLAMLYAQAAMRKERERAYFQALGVSFLLGVLFLVFQTIGWREMHLQGMDLSKNQGYSFLYILSGLHGLHVLGGLVVMGVSLFKSYRRLTDPVAELLFSVDPLRTKRIGLLATYWHFVDALWVYLHVFFVVNAVV